MRDEKGLSFLRLLFVNNLYWKLLSLVIAVLIYFTIRADISHVRVITVPVETEFESGAGGAVIESAEPRSLQVTLRGSYSEVSQLVASTVRCVVRPRQKTNTFVDAVEVKLGLSNLRGVRGVRVVTIEPEAVVVKFDAPMSLKLAVAPLLTEGKARGRVELACDQTHAVVKGSRRLLSPLDVEKVQIQSAPINVEGRSQTFSTRVRLLPPGDAVNALVEPPEITVNVVIINEKATAKIERVPVIVSRPFESPARWRTEPEVVDVELTGRSEVVKAVSFGQVMASVNGNLPLAPNATNEVPVMVHVQQGLSIDEVTALPASVKLIPITPLPAETQPKGP